MKEIWKDVKGYEGLYQISNLGNVISTARGKEKIRKQSTDRDGYKHIALSRNGRATNYFIHRLVADAFIENPENMPVINHKDENKCNNRVDNLEWCTVLYNRNYGSCPNKVKSLATKLQGKAVIQKDLNGNILSRFESVADAGRATGIEPGNICGCCKGRLNRAKGYKWEYA